MSTEHTPNNEVANRAYRLWEQAGSPHGRDLEFWIQAEAEIQAVAWANKRDLGAAPAREPLQAVRLNRPPARPTGGSQPRPKPPAERSPRGAAPRAR